MIAFFFIKLIILCATVGLYGNQVDFKPTIGQPCHFLAQEKERIWINQEAHPGDNQMRHPMGCDFSIPLAIMGFDQGILIDEHTPVWPYLEGYETFLNVWKNPQTPRSWIINSCVWYSGLIIEQLGIPTIHN